MHLKTRQKPFSIMLIFFMMLSLLTPIAEPVTQAAEASDAISVQDAIAKNNDGSEATVEGYIVGYVISPENVTRTDFREDHNVAIADKPEETDINNMLYVQLTSSYRADFGLASNPDNLDKQITVTGDLEAYHLHNGLKNPSAMSFSSDEPGEPLELLTIEEARDQGTGTAKTKGIVTAKLKNTIQIQDDTSAIAVRPTSLDVDLGDEITVTGNLQEYRGLLQLDGATLSEHGGNHDLPEPLLLTGSDLNAHQSKLVAMGNITITNVYDGGDWANYTAEDPHGTEFLVRDEYNQLDLDVGATYDSITGIASQFDDDTQLIPRDNYDIIADDTVTQPVYATPQVGTVPAGTDITLDTRTDGAEIYYTLDGSDPAENGILYDGPIRINSDVTIKAIAQHEDLASSVVTAFSYTVYDADEGLRIHHIQGEGHESPMVGNRVEHIEGIVTYKYNIQGANYFHMQTPEEAYDGNPKTSEGIVVYTGRAENIDIGDLVEVTGTVDEYHIDGYNDRDETDLSVTQINARDDRGGEIVITQSDVELPEPVTITSSDIPSDIIGEEGFDVFEPELYAIDFWESFEGMRVEVGPSKAVAPQEHGDLVVVTEEYETDTINGGIRLTEDGQNAQMIQFKLQPNGPARDFAVKTGDQFTEEVTGVVNYGFNNYKIYSDLTDLEAAFEEGDTEPESTSIVKDDDKLTVAAYNVENFSANSSQNETPQAKAENIARAFVQDMESPDIVGVIEVQDNNGQSQGPDGADASESYQRLIDEIELAGGPEYDYVNIDPKYNQDGGAPHGNIRVGFLYNPERVSLGDSEFGHGDATDATVYQDGQLSFNPGRIDPMNDAFQSTRKPLAAQFEFQGESVVVVANHLNSKSGDDPVFGQNQPPRLGSEAQRLELAQILNNFVKDIKTENPDENIIMLGDMNDFEFSAPLDMLKGDELTNMIDEVPQDERYTYIFQGNSQVLDHILVSNHLADNTEIDILHVNADFTEMHGRASDHEPLLAQIDLSSSDGGGDDGNGDDDPVSAASMIAKIEQLADEGELENNLFVRTMILHLTAVNHFETQSQSEKVVKHMDSFIDLLDQMNKRDLISKEVHDSLQADAERLITKWE